MTALLHIHYLEYYLRFISQPFITLGPTSGILPDFYHYGLQMEKFRRLAIGKDDILAQEESKKLVLNVLSLFTNKEF